MHVIDTDINRKRRHGMVESQLRPNKVTDPMVLNAFAAIPREDFVPASCADLAYIDEDLMTGDGGFLLEPMILARMLQALAPDPGGSVLDIGGQGGYGAALLSRMVQSVLGLLPSPEAAAAAEATLARLDIDNAVILHGDLTRGHPENMPYQGIVIEGAVEYVPDDLLAQLAPGGRLVTILRESGAVQGRAVLYTRTGKGRKGRCIREVLFDANTPSLAEFTLPQSFSFGG